MEKMMPAQERKISTTVRATFTDNTSSFTLAPSYGMPTVQIVLRIIIIYIYTYSQKFIQHASSFHNHSSMQKHTTTVDNC